MEYTSLSLVESSGILMQRWGVGGMKAQKVQNISTTPKHIKLGFRSAKPHSPILSLLPALSGVTHPKNPGESRSCFSAAIRPVLPHMFKRYWRVVWFVTQIIMTWALFLVLLLFSQVLQHGEGRMIERSNLNCGPLEIRRFRCVDPLQEQASGGRSESAQMSVHVGDEGAVTVVDKNSLEALSAQELRRSGLDCSLDDLSIHPIIDRLKPLQYNAYAGSLQAAQSSVHVEDDGVVAAGASKLSETESVGSTPFEARSLATNSSETLTVGGDRRSDLKCGPLEIHRYRCDPPQEP